MDLKELNNRTDNIRKRRRWLYQLAKELGFSSTEAGVLANSSEENIRKLAKEKGIA